MVDCAMVFAAEPLIKNLLEIDSEMLLIITVLRGGRISEANEKRLWR
jgi:hypothetical protein